MNSISSLATHPLSQPTSVTAYDPEPATLRTNGILSLDGTVNEEEPYTIKCVCGYHDDDGSTVLCERCNTWQHIECYYPTKIVPEIHACVDCDPRLVDGKQAAERQKRLRDQHSVGDRRVRRPAPKSQKRKTKDQAHAAGLTNGWPASENAQFSHDRKSDSPRGQQPPVKRPKNAHRASGSTSSQANNPTLAPNVRKRAESSHLRQSPTKSPSTPGPNGYYNPLYSPEFVQFQAARSNFQLIDVNSYHNIGVTSSLSTWLKDPVALANVTNGRQKAEVFQSYDKPVEELPAPNITKHLSEDPAVSIDGMHPVWHWLTIDEPRPKGAFIGELKGQIGRREDYIEDPSNRWATLRHPEPFVFFPRHLPIYIDTRFEGTMLRYVRRSCHPNLNMTIIITEGLNYHFCFIAQKDIAQDEEITIGWELDEDIRRLLDNSLSNGNIKKEGFQVDEEQYISNWVSGVLANFGGCACDRPMGGCLMDRFVRYQGPSPVEVSGPQVKQAKSRRRKAGNQVSPLSTGQATNSRANSEAFTQGEQEDDNGDNRSATSSSRSKPASRDMTPMTHASGEAIATVGSEMSDREKRKLLHQERLFEQLEHDEQHGTKRRKRGSGPTPNTPGPVNSHHLDLSGCPVKSPANTSNPRLGPDSSQSYFGSTPGGQKVLNGHLPPPWPATPLTIQRVSIRPTYAESSTQTGTDAEPGYIRPTPLKRKRHVSFTQRMLQKCHDKRVKRDKDRSSAELNSAPEPLTNGVPKVEADPTENYAGIEMPPPVVPLSGTMSAQEAPVPVSEQHDVQMHDPPTESAPEPISPVASKPPTDPMPVGQVQLSHPPIQPPAPPWALPGNESVPAEPPTSRPKSRTPSLHVQLPPAPQFSSPSPTASSAPTTSTSITGAPLAQSPSSTISQPPLFSPTVAGVVTPSPAKKRISFSDYLSRKSSAAAQTHSSSNVNPAAGPPTRSAPSTVGPSQPSVTSPSTAFNPPILRTSSSLANEIKVPEAARDAPGLEAMIHAIGDEQLKNGTLQEEKPA